MEFWTELGIEKTKDEEAITAAYREKLRLVNPEDKPEEFMKLRAEYEAALKYAREAEKEAVDPSQLSPLDAWKLRLEQIYNEFPRRVDLNEWKEMLNDELCEGIDSRLDVRDALLTFIMSNDDLPKPVYELLDEKFSLRENYDELCEKYPKEFIDNVIIGCLDGDPILPYELFDESTTGNPDGFIRLWLKARSELSKGEYDNMLATMEDMEKTGVIHPFTDLLRARYLWNCKEEKVESLAIAERLFSKHPENLSIRLLYFDMLYNNERYEEALAGYNEIVEKYPKHTNALIGKARCLEKNGELEEAKKIYFKLLDTFPNDNYIMSSIENINKQLKDQYDKKVAEGTDFETRMDYAWSCLQTDEEEKALELALGAEPENIAQRSDRENILTKIYLSLKKYEDSLSHAREWQAAVKELPEGETEIEKKRKGKTGEAMYLEGLALSELGKNEEALAKADEIIALENASESDLFDARTLRRGVLHRIKKYSEAAEEAEKIVELRKNGLTLYFLGLMQFDAGNKQEAFHAFGEALEYSRDLGSYIYRARILADYDEWDGVQQIVDFLAENGIDTDSMKYLRARKLESEEKKEEALALYNEIIESFEKGEDGDSDAGAVIYEVYSLAAELQEKTKEPEELVAMLDKGLAEKDDYYPLLSFKAFLLDNKLDKHQEAMDIYKYILSIYPRNTYAIAQIGHIYFDNMQDYDSALEYYRRYLELKQDSHINNCAARCLTYFRKYEEAEELFRKAIELDAENLNARSNFGMLYEYQFEFEKSLELQEECYRKNLERKENGSRFINKNYARILCRLGRHEEALKVLLESLGTFNSRYDASGVVEVCLEGGMWQKAESYAKQFFDSNLLDSDQRAEMIADARRMLRDDKEYLRQTEQIKDDDASKFARLARFYQYSGKYDKALEYYKKLIALGNDSIYDNTSYLEFLRATGNKAEAKRVAAEYINKTAHLKNEPWHYALYPTKMAFIHIYSGEVDKARKFIDEALNTPLCEHCRYGKCKDAIMALGEYYEAVGDYDKAIETFREGHEVAVDEYDFVRKIEEIQKKYRHKLKKENRK